jgi:transcriptional regulator with XRE-family HTH domain
MTTRVKKVSRSEITDQLMEIIERSRMTPYEIAMSAGVSPSTITRFLSGERSLKLDTLDLLAGVLGLRLTGKARRPVQGVKHKDTHR